MKLDAQQMEKKKKFEYIFMINYSIYAYNYLYYHNELELFCDHCAFAEKNIDGNNELLNLMLEDGFW